jgi:hypothetical protein
VAAVLARLGRRLVHAAPAATTTLRPRSVAGVFVPAPLLGVGAVRLGLAGAYAFDLPR